MKKIVTTLVLTAFLFAGCASYVAVSSVNEPQIPEISKMDKIGIVFLPKVKGNGHFAIGGKNDMAVPDYPELDGSVVINVSDDTIRDKYLSPESIAEILENAAADVLGNGPSFEYRYTEGFAFRPFIVSNEIEGQDGQMQYIESADAVSIPHDLDYRAKDRDIIPLAISAGKEYGIDALVVIRAELITEGGRITSFKSGETTGNAVGGDFMNPLSVGDYFARTELYLSDCTIVDAESGNVIAEIRKELSGKTVLGSGKFTKLDSVRDVRSLNDYFRSPSYQTAIKNNCMTNMAVLVPLLRVHNWTYYEAE